MIKSIKTELFELNILDTVSTNYKLHTHENICICAIKQGKMLFFHDGEDLWLTSGEIIVFNTNQPHFLKNHKDITRYHILHIHKDVLLYPKIIKDPSTYKKFFSFCDQVLEGEQSHFIDKFLQEYQTNQESSFLNKNFETIKKYIDSNLNNILSLDELAQKTNLNSSYLSRGFKKKYGLSPTRYIFNKRVHLSKKLLDEGKEITQIALELGFFDQSHFYKAFKSIFSITPNEYKHMKRVR
ncbi:MAG: AraC family transcriptional regulator [Sulfurospirillaceae bacterium]|nr:AraC family transcriptional regulator [Sulfurospirillaceae bacterium]